MTRRRGHLRVGSIELPLEWGKPGETPALSRNGIRPRGRESDRPPERSRGGWVFLLIFGFLVSGILDLACGAEIVDLAPIVREVGLSPVDVLMDDPIVPKRRGAVSTTSSSGGVETNLVREVPTAFTGTGQPGAVSQIRGMGRSSSDTQVQALGVPLSPPQGGGFDFSVFPGYLWSEYQLQLGAVAGGPDPRGVSGALTLVPWTADALSNSWTGVQAMGLHSTAGLTQLAARGANETTALAQVYSVGKARGPTTGFSWTSRGETRFKAHLLLSDIDAESPGSRSYPTPLARQRTTRWIPILQTDLGEGRPSFSAFYDSNRIRYSDTFYATDDRIQQLGFQSAWRVDENWRFGILARRTAYQKVDFDAPSETLLQAQVTRTHRFGESWLFEPTFQALVVTRYGFAPTESLGLRYELSENNSLYSRFSFTKKIPTLTDRYYQVSNFFIGNPNLEPETVWTLAGGFEGRHDKLGATIQYRSNAQVNSTLAGGELFPVNQGGAWVVSLHHRVEFELGPDWNLTHALSWNHSVLTANGLAFPYLPMWMDVLQIRFKPMKRWVMGWDSRFASGAIANTTTGMRVGGYGLHDLSVVWVPFAWSLQATFKIENFLNRAAEPILDYPVQGRAWILSLSAGF